MLGPLEHPKIASDDRQLSYRDRRLLLACWFAGEDYIRSDAAGREIRGPEVADLYGALSQAFQFLRQPGSTERPLGNEESDGNREQYRYAEADRKQKATLSTPATAFFLQISFGNLGG